MSGPGAAWRLAVGTLTVFPVRPVEVDRAVAGRAMSLAPFVGLLLGLAAAVVLAVAGAVSGSPLLGAVLAVAALAWLTRALHLDGLADLADGLGSGRPADGALEVMKRSDIGPFGVVTVVIALLVQVAALSRGGAVAWVALVAAAVTGRLAVTWACREGVPPARPTGLGALVAGTVRRGAAIGTTLVSAAVVAVLALVAAIGAPAFCVPAADGARVVLDLGALFPAGFDSLGNDYGYPVSANGGTLGAGPPLTGLLSHLAVDPFLLVPAGLLLAMAAGLGAAALLRRRAVRRLGGVTGDVLGALVETATTVTLLTAVLLL
ncbi:adenosylcobinamide-GDP ribazoletransferase [Microbispora bryophytorum]|uniref:Adenosylcobinamide-GDP ribazoletransferase n=1 Tax=Microbispora bryophytorum subsp. camponoti TaxID=1677852 RepID=A0ABR8KV41_9ACTN|nr:adenosylcobinamide-GDP ribazoletransferase [Microbispora camponoti]MBD3142627.1 adenosylcobinamide-GDP ribazoletransferase [Microbispora camponoti]